jgi:hypothetical protein
MNVSFSRVIKGLKEILIVSFVIVRFSLENALVLTKCSLISMGTREKIALLVRYRMMGLSSLGDLYRGGYQYHQTGIFRNRGT